MDKITISVVILTFLQVLPYLCNANSASCYWVGTAPNCESSCQSGEYVAGTSSRENGTNCTSGQRRYCCLRKNDTTISSLLTRRPISVMTIATIPVSRLTTTTLSPIDGATPSTIASSTLSSANQTNLADGECRWVGEGPNCISTCLPGERVAAVSSEGEGTKLCKVGSRKYCCKIVTRRRLTPKPVLPEQVLTTTQKIQEASMGDSGSEATTALPTVATVSTERKNFTQTVSSFTTTAPTSLPPTSSSTGTTKSKIKAETAPPSVIIGTSTEFPSTATRNVPAFNDQDLITQKIATTTASSVVATLSNSSSLSVTKGTDLQATSVNAIPSNSVNSTVRMRPKIRPTLPPLPIVPLIFRNFKALNSSVPVVNVP